MLKSGRANKIKREKLLKSLKYLIRVYYNI